MTKRTRIKKDGTVSVWYYYECQRDENGKKKYEGYLRRFDERTFTVDTGKEEMSFERAKVAHVEPLIRF